MRMTVGIRPLVVLHGSLAGLLMTVFQAVLPSTVLAQSTESGTSASATAPDEKPQRKARADWAEIELKGTYPETNAMPGLFGDLVETLPACIDRLQQAARDRSIKGVLLHINGVQIGFARQNELRIAIDAVQAAGKPVWARMDDGGNMDYLLAVGCDRILMPESGTLMLTGLRAEVMFYKNLFDKLDIQADMLRVGAFKSAAEPYTRSEMSDEFRQEMEEILDDRYADMVQQIADGRKLSANAIQAAIDGGVLPAQKALQLGLVDELAYEDQLPALVAATDESVEVRFREDYRKKKISPELDLFTLLQLLSGSSGDSGSSRPRIAVLRLEGEITSGSDPLSLFSTASINSDRIVPLIHKLSSDENVKAIVLRVDSPGGSALASDLIWRALEAGGKPVVASMSDTAASGGYYISMGADAIFAEPGTITGSIGVVGGKIAIEGLLKKIGVTTSVIRRGQNSGVLSLTSGFTESERQAMQASIDNVYELFTRKAAEGRKMDVVALEKLARGRVYTGRQALKIGLVDHLGTLADAVAHARKLAGDTEGKLELDELPKPVSPLEMLLSETTQGPQPIEAWLQALPESLRPAVDHIRVLDLFSREHALTILPFTVRFE